MKLLTLLFCCLNISMAFSEDIPVMVYASRNNQNDSVKGNIVEIISPLVYKYIVDGNITLWDSPKKQLKISATTLKNIETSSRTKFNESINMFVYETWVVKKKEVSIKPFGLAFTNKTPTGDDVSYGFVDYKDISNFLKLKKIPGGADGYYNITAEQKLVYKDYVYTILQYNGQFVKGNEKTIAIKNEIFKDRKIVNDVPPIITEKLITTSIEFAPKLEDKENNNSKLFLKAIEDFLKANEEVFFNYGGSKITAHLKHPKVKVSRIELSELWNKTDNNISYKPVSMVIYVNDKALDPLSMKELSNWKIQVGFQTAEEFINEKAYYFVLMKINDQNIKLYESLKYQKALLTKDWSSINAAVKGKE